MAWLGEKFRGDFRRLGCGWATAPVLLIRADEERLRRKILHRGDRGKAEKNLRKIEVLTAEMRRAQRETTRVRDTVYVVASWGAASSAPTAYFWNRERWGEGGSETRFYNFKSRGADLGSEHRSGQAGSTCSPRLQGDSAGGPG